MRKDFPAGWVFHPRSKKHRREGVLFMPRVRPRSGAEWQAIWPHGGEAPGPLALVVVRDWADREYSLAFLDPASGLLAEAYYDYLPARKARRPGDCVAWAAARGAVAVRYSSHSGPKVPVTMCQVANQVLAA